MRNLSAAILVGAIAFAMAVNAQTPQPRPDPNQTPPTASPGGVSRSG